MIAARPLETVQRRHGHIHVSCGDHRSHVTEEQRQVQRGDMGAVHVGIGHHDDLVVADLGDVEVLAVAAADRGDQRLDGVGLHHAVDGGAFGVENLASKRQDGLRFRVSPLNGGAACRITLDDEQLALFGVAGLAVLELVGHAGRLENRLAPGVLAGFLRRDAGAGGFDGLLDDVLGLGRVGVEPVAELVGHHALHEGLRLGVAELGLRLPFELRSGQLDGHDGGQAFAHIVAGEVVILLLEDVLVSRIPVHQRGQRCTEAFFVRAALCGGDRVRERVHSLGIRGGPLHRDLGRDADLEVFGLEIDDILLDGSGLAGLDQVRDIILDAVHVLVSHALVLRLGGIVIAGHFVAGQIRLAQVGE